METVFEARQPDGKVFRIFMDGSVEGFADGTFVTNHWVRWLNLERGLRIKAAQQLRIASEENAKRLLSGLDVGRQAEAQGNRLCAG